MSEADYSQSLQYSEDGGRSWRCPDKEEAERRVRYRSGRRMTQRQRKLQAERDTKAGQLHRERACSLYDACPKGGPRHCVNPMHRSREWPYDPPDVEILRGDKWEAVSAHPGSRYSPRLTWKALREQGAFA
jgi:hypothetical protein